MGVTVLTDPGASKALGYPDSIDVGTGISGPQGLEASFEFNGIYLNRREWLDTYIITSIDGLFDADVRDTRDVNPAQHGETALNAFYGGRTIVLTGKIRAHRIQKLRDMQQALREAFADISQERPFIIHTGDYQKDLQISARKNQPIAGLEVQSDGRLMRDFQITLRASNPRFLSIQNQSVAIEAVDGTEVQNAINLGNFAAQPVIELTNQMADVQLVNETTGVSLLLTSVADNETLTVDIANRKITDQNGVKRFSRLEIGSDWLELQPGTNNLYVDTSSAAGDAGVTVQWRDTFI